MTSQHPPRPTQYRKRKHPLWLNLVKLIAWSCFFVLVPLFGKAIYDQRQSNGEVSISESHTDSGGLSVRVLTNTASVDVLTATPRPTATATPTATPNATLTQYAVQITQANLEYEQTMNEVSSFIAWVDAGVYQIEEIAEAEGRATDAANLRERERLELLQTQGSFTETPTPEPTLNATGTAVSEAYIQSGLAKVEADIQRTKNITGVIVVSVSLLIFGWAVGWLILRTYYRNPIDEERQDDPEPAAATHPDAPMTRDEYHGIFRAIANNPNEVAPTTIAKIAFRSMGRLGADVNPSTKMKEKVEIVQAFLDHSPTGMKYTDFLNDYSSRRRSVVSDSSR